MPRSDAVALIDQLQHSARSAGVVHLDLDRFHQVNTQWGHHVGDLVLEQLGARLAQRTPAGTLVCSTDGDAFAVVVPDADWLFTMSLAEVLVGAVAEPVVVGEGDEVVVRASAGISWKATTDGPIDLYERAYLACRRAKETAPGSVIGYEYSLGEQAVRFRRAEEGLRRALVHDELRLFVQPEIDLRDGRVVGVEALVRWQHPTEGLLPPGAFLPDAAAAGLMPGLGEWVLDAAIDLAERWRTVAHGEPMRVWVNLAPQQLAAGERMLSRVRSALDAGRITPRSIGFEVTESGVLDDLGGAVGVLRELRTMGIEIALDDFGTGYSSLSYLRLLPMTAVKIDRSFVQGVGDSLTDEAIIEAVVDLSHALGLRVVAEGIEDVRQAQTLVRMGVDQAQGYYFGRPVDPAELEPLLSTRWCGADAPVADPDDAVRRAELLPGFGSPRARLLMAALDSTSDPVVVTAAAAGEGLIPPIVFVNDAFELGTGLRSRDVLGETIATLLAPDAPDELRAWFRDVYAGAAAATGEIPARRGDGTSFLAEISISPVFDERGVQTHWLHVCRDLTVRLAAENDRRRFQHLIEQTTSLVFIAERDGSLVYANAAQRRASGLGLDEPLAGLTAMDLFSPEQQRQTELEIVPLLRAVGAWRGESVFVNRVTGERTEVVADVQYVGDPLRPGTRFFAAVSRDVTNENRVAAEAVRRRELGEFAARVAQSALEQSGPAFLDGLATVISDLGQLLGADFAFLDSIDRERDVLRPVGGWRRDGYPGPVVGAEEVPLSRLRQWVDHLSRTTGVSGSWRAGDAPWSVELRQAFPGEVGGAAMVAPLRVGRVLLGLVGIASADDEHEWGESERETLQQVADTLANVLARLRDAEALHASERRLGAMLANVREILLVLDREGRIRYVNESAESALGTEIADAIGQHFLSFVHPDDHQSALEAFERQMILGVPTTIELRVLHGDGSVRWLEADSSLENPVVGGIMVSLRDVSSRHQAVWLAQRHAAHEKVLLELAQWALQVEPEDVFNGLHGHLELLGRTLDADMAFTALLDGNRLRNVAGWSATAAPLDYQLPADGRQLPALVAKFSQLETLVVDDIERFEGDWADEWRSFPVVDRAGLNVPLVSGGRCLGGLGVAMRHAPRSWLPDEIALVERVAGTVAALIAREQVEHELRRSEARLAALLDGSHDVVVVVDEAGVLRYANGAVRRLLGYEPEHLVGRSVFEFIVPADRKVAVERLASLSSDRFTPLSVLRLRAADGRVVAWEITSGAVQDPMVGGRVLACRDVTARLADEAAAARWVELLRFAFDVAQSALDVDALEFIERLPDLCAGIARLLQVDMVYVDQFDEDRRVIANLGGWVTREHSCPVLHNGEVVSFSAVPRWLERLRRAEPVVVEDLSVSSEPWAREKVRVLGPVGGSLAVPMSSAGELMGVFGVAMSTSTRRFGDDEVTFMRIVAETLAHVLERSRLDAALRHSEARFRLLSETAADLVIMVGLDGVLRYVSPSSLALLGVPAHQLVGTPAEDLIHPDDREDASQDISRMLADGPTMSEMRLRRSDGSYIWVVNSTSSIVDPVTGRVNGLRASLRDISDRKRLEAELEHQALHDPLTGLGNRILLQRRLDAAVGAAEIVDHPASPRVSVLLADLDGFKFVNDTHGHAFGDEVLRIVASRLRSHCRPQDTLARTGGDEFVLLCPGTDATSAVEIAQRLVDAIRSPISVGEVSVDLGVSIGVAHREGLVADSDELLIEADRAMYAAKRDGRCRVALVDRVVT